MSNRLDGRNYKGAGKLDRRAKRAEAEARNAKTLPERRKAYRRSREV